MYVYVGKRWRANNKQARHVKGKKKKKKKKDYAESGTRTPTLPITRHAERLGSGGAT